MGKSIGLLLGGALLGAIATFGTQVIAGQPHMRNALNSLQTAKQQLSVATHDKEGHRVKALELTQQAIAETQAGIRAGAQ